MTKYLWTLMICAALGVSSSACGADDDDDDMGGTGGIAGMTSGTGGGGSGGRSGAGGSSGAAGGAATSVPCGTSVCTGPMLPAFIPAGLAPAPCCLNSAANMCGQSMGGAACAPPPPPAVNDPRCPALMLGPLNVPGCCMNNDCGVNASMIGLGCMVNTGGMAMGLPLPAARKCDAPPDMMMMGDDAGI